MCGGYKNSGSAKAAILEDALRNIANLIWVEHMKKLCSTHVLQSHMNVENRNEAVRLEIILPFCQ